MEKVYIVQYDNCELYEDNFVCTSAVFRNKLDAENYIINKGYYCRERKEDFNFNIKEDGIRISPYYYELIEDEYCTPGRMYIEEWNLR